MTFHCKNSVHADDSYLWTQSGRVCRFTCLSGWMDTSSISLHGFLLELLKLYSEPKTMVDLTK